MDSGKTLEARLLGKDSVVSGCTVLALCTCCIRGVVYIWCCVRIAYVMLCTFGVVHMLHM